MPGLPAEIIFLRAVTPLYPANQADIIFDITEGNLRDSFDIIKRYTDGMTVGECPLCCHRAQAYAAGSEPPSQIRSGIGSAWHCVNAGGLSLSSVSAVG